MEPEAKRQEEREEYLVILGFVLGFLGAEAYDVLHEFASELFKWEPINLI